MDILFRHAWAVLLVGTVIMGVHRWWRARAEIAPDPRREVELRRFFLRVLAFFCVPWALMGLGVLVGGVDGLHDYFRPGYWTPWVLVWWVATGGLVAAWLVWLLFFDGAQKLLDHRVLTSEHATKPWQVKAYAGVGAVGMIGALLFKVGMAPLARLGAGETADGFRTVFVVYAGFWKIVGIALGFTAVGVGVLVFSLVWLRRRKRQKEPVDPKRKWTPWFMLVWSVLWLLGGSPFLALMVLDSYGWVRAYEEGEAQVVEGVVHVLREQSAEDHGDGDLVEIGGVELTVNRFAMTPGYVKAIAHGGALREGALVRVWHYEGGILRVDLREDDALDAHPSAPDDGPPVPPGR